jgi:hypothetical protein
MDKPETLIALLALLVQASPTASLQDLNAVFDA